MGSGTELTVPGTLCHVHNGLCDLPHGEVLRSTYLDVLALRVGLLGGTRNVLRHIVRRDEINRVLAAPEDPHSSRFHERLPNQFGPGLHVRCRADDSPGQPTRLQFLFSGVLHAEESME